jgi:predicted NBD/HSP70 family sugar kinase
MDKELESQLAQCRPAVVPECDPDFRPVILPYRLIAVQPGAADSVPVRLAVERENGFVSVFETALFERAVSSGTAFRVMERALKFFLWSRGGWRVFFQGPVSFFEMLRREYSRRGARAFDVAFMSDIYAKPFELLQAEAKDFPESRERRSRLGGHFDGCRVGFDLGASDYKVAAVVDGKPVYEEEIPWNPAEQQDPEYHYREIQSGLRKAASRLPRVDAIGGSAAGIYVNKEPRAASLFRSVPKDLFDSKVRTLFERIAAEWRVPFEVVNDGEVTALAGRLSFGSGSVLGIAMGSSQAAGYINEEGFIPGWLDELAFAPLDLSPTATPDEWSGDAGVGAQYFSQQAVARLAAAAGLSFPDDMRLPERLKAVQELLEKGDELARRVFASIGVYLGYAIPWYEVFYSFRHLVVLGRVMSGRGGEVIMSEARAVLEREFPETAGRVELHLLDEKSRRVGQAVAAASLPETDKEKHQ